MDKYKEQYSELTEVLQAKVSQRENKKTTWVTAKYTNISEVKYEELQSLFRKANLVDWDSFIIATNNILKLGRATYQFQKNSQSISQQLSQVKKAIKQSEKLLDTFADEVFPYDSLLNSYLNVLENETYTQQNPIQAKDIRSHLCKTVVALYMLLDDHETSKGKHRNNYDNFIIELSRLFVKHNGNTSKYSQTHFYRFISICMEEIGNNKFDYEPIIKKALKHKSFIDGNNITP